MKILFYRCLLTFLVLLTLTNCTRNLREQWQGPEEVLVQLELVESRSFQSCYTHGFLDARYLCEYTEDSVRFHNSQAALFRGRRLDQLPLPQWRPPGQKWIFYEFEPPHKVWQTVNLTKYNHIFNVTGTFSMDSDIPIGSPKVCTRDNPKWAELQSTNYASKKRTVTPVAWFASVCRTQSRREDYVEELARHIPVHVYGACGNKTCGSPRTWKSDNCTRRLLHGHNSYKFYLAFENSLCEDYVTEKLWKVRTLDVVPVVMGAVDYANILPKDSYIDVRDFDSPKDLAMYLHHLNQNDDLYNQYIRNKNSLHCSALSAGGFMPWHCKMCQYLHKHREQSKELHALDHFWGSRRCLKPKYFRNQHDSSKFYYS